jgi:hypothetical protein
LDHISYANTFLFPLAVMKRLSERLFPSRESESDLTVKAGGLNSVFKFILSSEAPMIARSGLPFGLSVVAVGRKRS